MAWIESHQSLGTHIKLRRLARALNIHRAQAIGHLHYLWWWALDAAPSGDLSAFLALELAEVCEWPGDADTFLAALRDCGWLDPDGRIHNWDRYVGRILAFRESNRKRQRRRRKVLRNGDVTRDVRVTSRVRSSPVTGLPYRTSTVPVPTGTQPTEEHPSVPVCVSPVVDAQPEGTHTEDTHTDSCWPTLPEVLTRAELRGIPKDCAEKWWHEHDARGGCDRHGQPLKRWESALIAFATSWRAVEAQRKARNSEPQKPARPPIDWSKGFFGDKPTP